MSGEHIRAVQTIEGTNDAEVILKAVALLDTHPEHQIVEIWDGKRMVALVPRKSASLEQPLSNSPLSIITGDAKKDGE
jgi:hypothetical protein